MKRVMVYEDPLTRQKLEGSARIIGREATSPYGQDYRVVRCVFDGDAEPDVFRTVFAEDIYEACETCNGTGTIERTIGGDGYGGRCAAEADVPTNCPDCKGVVGNE